MPINKIMKITFNKEIYTREALIKAAYKFSDKAYIHLDMDDIYYLVDVDIKPGNEEITEKEFINAMLSEMLRIQISKDTKNIRELIFARALASTVIEKTPGTDSQFSDILLKNEPSFVNGKSRLNENAAEPIVPGEIKQTDTETDDIQDILTDWFVKYD